LHQTVRVGLIAWTIRSLHPAFRKRLASPPANTGFIF
jgi:hypothetical protein